MYQKVAVDKRSKRKSLIYRNYLKQYMTKNGITIMGLTEISKLSETTIKQIRQHRQEPQPITKVILCKALKVDMSVIFPMDEVVCEAKRRCGNKYVRKEAIS